jgi:glutaredoxin
MDRSINKYIVPSIKQAQIGIKKFSSSNYMYLVALVTIFLIVIVIIIWRNKKYDTFEPVIINDNDNDNNDSLTNMGWIVYMTPTCPFCKQQKNILNEYFPNFKNIKYDGDVSVVPTWYNINTQEYKYGLLDYDKLLELVKTNNKQYTSEWIVYMSRSCPFCIKQKAILDKDFPNFNNIKYDGDVSVVPTWYNTTTQEYKYGLQSKDTLSSMLSN